MKQMWLARTLYLMAECCLCCRTAQLLGCGPGKLAYGDLGCPRALTTSQGWALGGQRGTGAETKRSDVKVVVVRPGRT